MSNRSNTPNADNTSSGQGALGMGGSPSDADDLRQVDGRWIDDLGSGTGPIPGAFGSPKGDPSGGNVAGVPGDHNLDAELERASHPKPDKH